MKAVLRPRPSKLGLTALKVSNLLTTFFLLLCGLAVAAVSHWSEQLFGSFKRNRFRSKRFGFTGGRVQKIVVGRAWRCKMSFFVVFVDKNVFKILYFFGNYGEGLSLIQALHVPDM